MPKWSAKKEGKLLCSLFDEGVADPSFTKASDIDEIKILKPEFAYFTDRRFRDNYKSTGKSWMVARSVSGLRFEALSKLKTLCIFQIISQFSIFLLLRI